MATKTFGGTAGNWSDDTKWEEGTHPGIGDDVVFDSGSASCVMDTYSADLKSFDMTGYTGTFSGSQTVTVIGVTSATVVCKIAGTITWTGPLSLKPTAASTTIQLTTNGKTIGSMTVNGSGTVTFMDGVTVSNTITLSNGTLDTNSQTVVCSNFQSTSGTRTLTLGSSSFTVSTSGAGYACWRVTSSLTLNAGTSTINCSYAGSNPIYFTGGALTYNTVTIDTDTGGSYTWVVSNANTFSTLTITGGSTKRGGMSFDSDQTITGTLNLNGDSSSGRLIILSSALGTARTFTLTGASVSCSNVDFRDITMTPAQDLSAITGGSGDCGGNTGITFTTADNWYWNGSGTRNFSDYTYWYTATNGGGSQMASTLVPLPQDTCYFDSSSIDGTTTVDLNLVRIPSIDFTGVAAMSFHMDNAPSGTTQGIYGSLILVTNVSLTAGAANFLGRGNYSLDMAGKSFGSGNVGIYAIGGKLTLLSALTNGNQISLYYGEFDANDFNVTTTRFNCNGSSTRVLTMGSGTFTVGSSSAVTVWDASGTNLTITPETSTIAITNSSSNNTFSGNGKTYNNLTCTNAGIVAISGSNTFNTLTIGASKTVQFTSATTQTVTSFVATGSAGSVITIQSTTATPAILSDASGTNTVHYCSITNMTATGGATWDASDNCTDGGGNTGWTWTSGSVNDSYAPSAFAVTGTLKTSTPNYDYKLIPSAITFLSAVNDPTIALGTSDTVTAPKLPLTLSQVLQLVSIGYDMEISSTLDLTASTNDPAGYVVITGITDLPEVFDMGMSLKAPSITAGVSGTYIVYAPEDNELQNWVKGTKLMWLKP